MSGVGGLIFGYVADRFGRTRALMGTILIFSLASLGAATSQSVLQLLFWRALLGIGMGGEWASGAVLVSETWPAEHRNKAISIMQSGWAIGYIPAALLAALILGQPSLGDEAWRWLFVVGVAAGAVRDLDPAQRPGAARRGRAHAARARRRGNPFAIIFGRALIGANAARHRCSAAPCSSRTGASSSGCRRFWRAPSSRAAPAWASSARCGGSSRCRSARISAT